MIFNKTTLFNLSGWWAKAPLSVMDSVLQASRVFIYYMKQLLVFILILSSQFVNAQVATTTTAPKGTNLLIIPHVSFQKCVREAIDEGMQIDKKDDSLCYFYTVPSKRAKSWTDTHVLYVRVKGDSVFISGTRDPHMGTGGMFRIDSTPEPIMVKGWRTGGYIPNFIFMDEYAHKLSDTVYYASK